MVEWTKLKKRFHIFFFSARHRNSHSKFMASKSQTLSAFMPPVVRPPSPNPAFNSRLTFSSEKASFCAPAWTRSAHYSITIIQPRALRKDRYTRLRLSLSPLLSPIALIHITAHGRPHQRFLISVINCRSVLRERAVTFDGAVACASFKSEREIQPNGAAPVRQRERGGRTKKVRERNVEREEQWRCCRIGRSVIDERAKQATEWRAWG